MRVFKQKKFYFWVAAVLCGCLIMITGLLCHDGTGKDAFAQGNMAEDVEQGRVYLCDHDIVNANISFKKAVSDDPADPVSNFFYSVTRILALVNDVTFNDLFDRFDVSSEGRNLYECTADFQRDMEGDIVLPNDAPTSGEVLAFLKDILLPEVEGALDNLGVIDDEFNINLYPEETLQDENLEVDYGDIALYRSALHALRSLILILDAYDLDLDIDDIVFAIQNDDFSINSDILAVYADFLKLKPSCGDFDFDDDRDVDGSDLVHFMDAFGSSSVDEIDLGAFAAEFGQRLLGEAKNAARNSISSYFDASEFIRNETDSQEDDLVAFDTEESEDEEEFRYILSDIQNSLNGPAVINSSYTLDLTQFFDDPVDLRDMLPEFKDDNKIIICEFPDCCFPDPAFDGILPDYNQDILINRLHLPVEISGVITCDSGNCTSCEIYVTAFDGPDHKYADKLDSVSLSSIGTYSLYVETGEDAWVKAFCDKDGDNIISPGDYRGAYFENPMEVMSENCSGPDNININLSDQVIGISGTITGNGQPVANAWIWISAWSEKCWQGEWLGDHSFSTDENGYFVVNDLAQMPHYLNVCIWTNTIDVCGWWDGSGGVTSDCYQAAIVTPGPGTTIINIEVP